MSKNDQKITATLFDSEKDHESGNVTIETSSSGISIRPHGTGTKTCEGGSPIWIERQNGEIRIYVWADINQEDPTHVISLNNAKEEFYKEKE